MKTSLKREAIQRAAATTVSWAPEVVADSSGQYCGNALRFATQEEALANARDLMGRWMLVTAYRAVESTDPVNYRWDAEKGLIDIKENADV